MLTLLIPTYRNPSYLDLCLKSAIENQENKNQILVVVDGYYSESEEILKKYSGRIDVLKFDENRGMQTALNYGVMNAYNDKICIINDDNVLSRNWDTVIENEFKYGSTLIINQIEHTGPSIFNFEIKNFGKTPQVFDYEGFLNYEELIRKPEFTLDGGIFPFVISKKDYMGVGGFDTLYESPFICDWDFFLKLDLMGVGTYKTQNLYFYHFGSTSTKNGKEGDKFRQTEGPAAELFKYKWGINPGLFTNNSHRPFGKNINGIQF